MAPDSMKNLGYQDLEKGQAEPSQSSGGESGNSKGG